MITPLAYHRNISLFFIALLVLLLITITPTRTHAGCSISAPTFTFGDYNPLITDSLDAIGSLNFECTSDTLNVQIAITNLTSGCSTSTLCMASNSYRLAYIFFLNAAHTLIWGNGTSNTQVYTNASPPPNTTVTVPIYGQISPLQNNPAAVHTGTVLATLSSNAGTTTTTMSTQTQVVASCLFPAASTSVDFGPLGTTLGTASATGSLTVQCNVDTLAKVGLDNGLNAISGQRKIKDTGTNTIDYALFQDAAHAVVWGNSDPDRLSLTTTGTNQTKTIYGTLNYINLVPAGTYSDTVIATVEF